MQVAVHVQRLADQQFYFVIRFIFLGGQVDNLALHPVLRLRIRGRFLKGLSGRGGIGTGAGQCQKGDDAFRCVFHSHSFLCQTVPAYTIISGVFCLYFIFIWFISLTICLCCGFKFWIGATGTIVVG